MATQQPLLTCTKGDIQEVPTGEMDAGLPNPTGQHAPIVGLSLSRRREEEPTREGVFASLLTRDLDRPHRREPDLSVWWRTTVRRVGHTDIWDIHLISDAEHDR